MQGRPEKRFQFVTRVSLLRGTVCLLLLVYGRACMIQGQNAGVCKPAQDIQDRMPFCADVVRYTACVPREVAWYPNLTIEAKDSWAQDTFRSFVNERLAIEDGDLKPTDPTKYNYFYDEVEARFGSRHGSDCMDAYRNFMCWLNFPRCDVSGQSLLLCRSVCENFFRACKYPKIMWRCYDPAFYGGKYAEGTMGDQMYDEQSGVAVFVRAPFPGLPFVENEFQEEDDEEPVVMCTPALRNAAPGAAPAVAAIALSVLAAAAAVLGARLQN